eukprot:7619379-Lingulodinium_polyedra.AAC.1
MAWQGARAQHILLERAWLRVVEAAATATGVSLAPPGPGVLPFLFAFARPSRPSLAVGSLQGPD